MVYLIGDIKKASGGLLDRPVIYYAIEQGWFRPTRVTKAKIDRFEFSEEDMRLAKAVAGYLRMSVKTRVAFERAMEDVGSKRLTGLDLLGRKGRPLREVLAEVMRPGTGSELRPEDVLCSPSMGEDERLKKLFGEGLLDDIEVLATASNLFQVSRVMLEIVREQEANAVFPVKPDAALLVGGILAVAHFMRVDLRLFVPTGDSDAGEAQERMPDTSALHVVLVDSVLNSAETVLCGKHRVEVSGAVVTGAIGMLDSLSPIDRERIQTNGCQVWSIHKKELLLFETVLVLGKRKP